jgi:hypothetical protein
VLNSVRKETTLSYTKAGTYTRPLSHFLTRCIATTMLRGTRVMARFPGFGCRLEGGMGNLGYTRCLKNMNGLTLPRKFLHYSLYFAIDFHKSALSNNSQSLNDTTGVQTYALFSKRSFHFFIRAPPSNTRNVSVIQSASPLAFSLRGPSLGDRNLRLSAPDNTGQAAHGHSLTD